MERLAALESKQDSHYVFMESQLAFVSQLLSVLQTSCPQHGYADDSNSPEKTSCNMKYRDEVVEIPRYRFIFRDVDINGSSWAAPPGLQPSSDKSPHDADLTAEHTYRSDESTGTCAKKHTTSFEFELIDDKEVMTSAGDPANGIRDSQSNLGDASSISCLDVERSTITGDPELQHACQLQMDSLDGAWWNSVQEAIVVDGWHVSIEDTHYQCEVKEGQLCLNGWILGECSEETATWTRDGEHVQWFRSQQLAKLDGRWSSPEYDSIVVDGFWCQFGSDEKLNLTVLKDEVFLNSWRLLGFGNNNGYAYWSDGSKHIHWQKEDAPSESDAEDDMQSDAEANATDCCVPTNAVNHKVGEDSCIESNQRTSKSQRKNKNRRVRKAEKRSQRPVGEEDAA